VAVPASVLRLGVSPFAATREGALRVASHAVEGGLDTLWLGDGLLVNPDFPGWSGAFEPFTELAWLAGCFPSARWGVTAAVLPLRDVAWLAKQAATLDCLTDGGFVLAVAPGFWAKELAWRGVAFAERGAVFADGLAALRAALAGRAHEGPYVSIPPEGRLAPEPFTPGGPPIWLAGSEATMRRALAEGLAFQASRVSPTTLRPWAQRWRDGGGGRLGIRIRVAPGDAAPAGHELAWEALTGPPSYLVDQLIAFSELGVSDVSIVPGQDDDTSLRTVDVLAEHVVPALRAGGIPTG